MTRSQRTPPKEMLALDSLRVESYVGHPFLYGQFDQLLFRTWLGSAIDQDLQRNRIASSVDRAEVDYEVEKYLNSLGPGTRAWLAHMDRRFEDALKLYALSVRDAQDRAEVHANRASVFYQIGRYDSAAAAMKNALQERSKEKKGKFVRVYESSASYEYLLGWVLETAGDDAGAREAFSRALLSDLAYYPAHIKLSRLTLEAGDTAGALSALKTALDIRETDGWLHFAYGELLLSAQRFDEAARELKRAVELEPHFAAPYFSLAQAVGRSGNRSEAAAIYRQFLERASRRDPLRAVAEKRLQEPG
jgi:tetratricopeptide (TPR) repeat protein